MIMTIRAMRRSCIPMSTGRRNINHSNPKIKGHEGLISCPFLL
jgi:hypothetical protein